MTELINNQAHVFLFSVAGGMIIGLLYDIFRIKRKTMRSGFIITCIEDLIYWAMVALVVFLTIYISNEGELRGYIFIGTILGVILYALILSRIVMKSALTVINIITRIVKLIINIIILCPIKIVFKILLFIFKPFRRWGRAIKKGVKNRMAKMAVWKKIFKNIRKKMLY